MGYLVYNECYETTSDALDAFYSAKEPYFYMAGTTSYYAYFTKGGTGWQIQRKSISSTGAITTQTAAPASTPEFPLCIFEAAATNEAKFADGVTIGWGIAAAMAIAYSYKLIQRAIS